MSNKAKTNRNTSKHIFLNTTPAQQLIASSISSLILGCLVLIPFFVYKNPVSIYVEKHILWFILPFIYLIFCPLVITAEYKKCAYNNSDLKSKFHILAIFLIFTVIIFMLFTLYINKTQFLYKSVVLVFMGITPCIILTMVFDSAFRIFFVPIANIVANTNTSHALLKSEFIELMSEEFYNSKRYDVPFTLSCFSFRKIEGDGSGKTSEADKTIPKNVINNSLKIIYQTLRKTDLLTQLKKNRIMLLYKNTTLANGKAGGERICELINTNQNIQPILAKNNWKVVSVEATYNNQIKNPDGLMELAEQKLSEL